MHDTSTLSPTRTFFTPEPTSSTVPIASWPRMRPSVTAGTSPFRMWRSVLQIVTAPTASRHVTGTVALATVGAMKAALLEQIPGELVIDDVQIGAIGPHDVLVRTVAAGLCHSDLHFMEGKYPCPVPSGAGSRVGRRRRGGRRSGHVPEPGRPRDLLHQRLLRRVRVLPLRPPEPVRQGRPASRRRGPAPVAPRRRGPSISSWTCRASRSSCSCTSTCS